jgi:hypothetical protein
MEVVGTLYESELGWGFEWLMGLWFGSMQTAVMVMHGDFISKNMLQKRCDWKELGRWGR